MRTGSWYVTNYGSTRFRCDRQHHPDPAIPTERFYVQSYSVRGELKEWDTQKEADAAAVKLNTGQVP